MIDKNFRHAKAERHGPMVVVHMTGGGDCLWMNMYLDLEHGQMTCDSDIGFYAYNFGKFFKEEDDFLKFCIKLFCDEDYILRKCIGERHVEKEFDRDASINELRKLYIEWNADGEDADSCEIDDVLEIAGGYDDHARFATALYVAAEERDVELPDEWWDFLVEDYTPWQKRFAEICREVIVPELVKLVSSEQSKDGDGMENRYE